MKMATIGTNGPKVSRLVAGTWSISGMDWGDTKDDSGIGAIHTLMEQGVNFIDTAPTYGFGASEELVGKALQGRRDQVILQTKCGVFWPGNVKSKAGSTKDSSREAVLRSMDESLKRLNTDYVDLLLIHWPDPNTPLAETADALKELKKAGKVRYTGCSNFSLEQCQEFYELGVLDAVQYGYSMVDRKNEPQLEWCHERKVLTQSYGTLGAGILAGKYRTFHKFPDSEARGRFYHFFQEPEFSRVMELLKTLDLVAEEKGKPLSEIAINWNLSRPFLDTVLCGSRNEKQALENAGALDWSLSPKEIQQIDHAIVAAGL